MNETHFSRLLVGTFIAFVLWAAYRLRVRVLTDRVRNTLAERLSERERIARELNDNLLQGMQGLILLFQSIAVQIPSETALASKLETAISHAERMMAEGRDRVRDLHDPNFDLADALRGLNAELPLPGTDYSVKVIGRKRELQMLVSAEVFKIAREAIVNAFQHASAGHVYVTLAYTHTSLNLIVADNGRDVSSDIAEDGGSGRWGLSGMKSRARKLDSKLLISNRSPVGTEVRLIVPSRIAYRAHSLFLFEWLQTVRHFMEKRGPGR